jgi:glycosyltransferase involved in cell wall biosynthesis
MVEPRIVVYSSLFPNAAQPNAGLFIRERMFRVARRLPLVVVSPKPWFPGQGLIRLFRPHYRPMPARSEVQDGITVLFPRFLSLPGMLRGLDGLFMALGSFLTLRRLKRQGYNLIDAHFAYPDGHAAVRLGRWLGLPVTVTLRGTELPHSRNPALRPKLEAVFRQADRVIAVSDSLRQLALGLGLPSDRAVVVGNGVDTAKFQPVDRQTARSRFRLPPQAKVLVTVGALVERKGFHRVIDCLPELLARHPDLYYLVVGGASPEGDMDAALRAQAARLGLGERVRFLGPIPPEALKWPLSAADVFVLATRNEGWANVILEAMAVGLPVVATDVGGNREVVVSEELGSIVPYGDQPALTRALDAALTRDWDREAIRAYARENDWEGRVESLCKLFKGVV